MLLLLCLPFLLVGGFWLVYWLGYHLSDVVAAGFVVLAGVVAEFGVVMLLYLDHVLAELRQSGSAVNTQNLQQAIIQGALLCICPKTMTVSVMSRA